jgi:hypothetical protein
MRSRALANAGSTALAQVLRARPNQVRVRAGSGWTGSSIGTLGATEIDGQRSPLVTGPFT